MKERSLVIIKPDAIERKLVGAIIGRIEAKGFNMVDAKMMMIPKEVAEDHYQHIKGNPNFPKLIDSMTNKLVLVMIFEGEGVIEGIRILMGPTDWRKALPGTIRGDYATSITYTLIHASDSEESAQTEIKRFFGL